MEIVRRDEKAWRTIHVVEQGACWECKQAIIYRGPWRKMIDDDGHVLERGKRIAVGDKTFQIYNRKPQADDILPIEKLETIPLDEAIALIAATQRGDHPQQTWALDYELRRCQAKTVVSRVLSVADSKHDLVVPAPNVWRIRSACLAGTAPPFAPPN